MTNTALNPVTLPASPFYSHGIQVRDAERLVFVSGQVGMTADGEISMDLGCGTEIVNEEYFESGGRTCHRVTLASKRDPAQEPTTKTACTKDAK